MPSRGLPVAVTCGEPAGIGPDITLMAFARRQELKLPPFYIRSDPAFLAARAHRLDLSVEIVEASPETAPEVFATALPVLPTDNKISDTPGVTSIEAGHAAIGSISDCVSDIRKGQASAVVTNPIHKKALYDAGFKYPGHTEYLGDLARQWGDSCFFPVMMLAGPDLIAVPVTTHIPLSKVPEVLTTDLIIRTARIVDQDLRNRFGIAHPRIAVAGLNPHAGECGAMGREDIDVIRPALHMLQQEGIAVTGPFPSDTLFHPEARTTYDCVLGMYHDQALIPVKTIAFAQTVNVTLGLPFVRTSPDHGTAFEIAGKGTAKPDSFIAALRMAAALSNTGLGSA